MSLFCCPLGAASLWGAAALAQRLERKARALAGGSDGDRLAADGLRWPEGAALSRKSRGYCRAAAGTDTLGAGDLRPQALPLSLQQPLALVGCDACSADGGPVLFLRRQVHVADAGSVGGRRR